MERPEPLAAAPPDPHWHRRRPMGASFALSGILAVLTVLLLLGALVAEANLVVAVFLVIVGGGLAGGLLFGLPWLLAYPLTYAAVSAAVFLAPFVAVRGVELFPEALAAVRVAWYFGLVLAVPPAVLGVLIRRLVRWLRARTPTPPP